VIGLTSELILHMLATWERQISTVRNILSVLLGQNGSQLDDESLRTFMVEGESIVNGCSLAVDSLTSPDGLQPLTPNTLLTTKSKVILPPPGNYVRTDLYTRKRWCRVQFLANEFWSRWKKEYLQSLQLRSKWIKLQRNLEVIVKDDTLARNNWKLGRIAEDLLDNDSLVRKVKIMMADSSLDNKGKRVKAVSIIERPVHSLVLVRKWNSGRLGYPH